MAKGRPEARQWANEPQPRRRNSSQHYAINLSTGQCLRWLGNR